MILEEKFGGLWRISAIIDVSVCVKPRMIFLHLLSYSFYLWNWLSSESKRNNVVRYLLIKRYGLVLLACGLCLLVFLLRKSSPSICH